MNEEEERTTARALRSSWVCEENLGEWHIHTIKGDIVASDIPTKELAEHIVNHHNVVVQEWHSLEREPAHNVFADKDPQHDWELEVLTNIIEDPNVSHEALQFFPDYILLITKAMLKARTDGR